MEELLKNFQDLLDNYSRHREYIKRARTQGSKFSPEIIEKVVLDHEIKSSTVADQILPLVPNIEGELSRIDSEKSEIEGGKASSAEQVQELELRHLIGELGDEDFEEASADLRKAVEEADARITALDAERTSLAAAMDRWVELATEAGQSTGQSASAPGEQADAPPVEDDLQVEPEPAPAAVTADDSSAYGSGDYDDGDGGDVEELIISDEPVVLDDLPASDGSSRGVHVGQASRDDLSAVLPEPAATVSEDDPIIPAMELEEEEVDVSDDIVAQLGVELDDDGDDGGELVHLTPADDGGDSIDDVVGIAIDIDDLDDAPVEPEASDEPRRALLLYQEGTAEEQIYPFTGDVLTVGRGRDNDIQIKNDSKVSRFHCKLFRRAANFYIEDNKSSNGTLVNGELITERRLFGGEEIVIGETFFRFRIM